MAELPPQADYWTDLHDSEVSDSWIGAKTSYFTGALELLERTTGNRRLLDVGGGIGYFAELAIERGWDAYALDTSPHASAYAATRLGADRVLQSFDDVQEASFDVATLWCVIAHTQDPHSLMASVRRCLSDEGTLWLTTPNFRFQKPYAAVRSLIKRPLDFAAEDHLGHFTLDALAKLLQMNGFHPPKQHFVGVTETCLLTGTNTRLLVGAKRMVNRAAHTASLIGIGNFVSELLVTAQADARTS